MPPTAQRAWRCLPAALLRRRGVSPHRHIEVQPLAFLSSLLNVRRAAICGPTEIGRQQKRSCHQSDAWLMAEQRGRRLFRRVTAVNASVEPQVRPAIEICAPIFELLQAARPLRGRIFSVKWVAAPTWRRHIVERGRASLRLLSSATPAAIDRPLQRSECRRQARTLIATPHTIGKAGWRMRLMHHCATPAAPAGF